MTLNKPISDHELVKKLQRGDLDAFDQIFKRYGNRLFGFALKYLKSKEDAEGLVQDVFLKVWENRKMIKRESSLKAYLFTIAYHNMCRIFRKRQINLEFIKKSDFREKLNVDLEEQIEYRSVLEQVEKLIEKLPEKQRQIFIKSRREGKCAKLIAQEMKIAPGTVDNNISAALKFLSKQISRENLSLLLFFAVFVQ